MKRYVQIFLYTLLFIYLPLVGTPLPQQFCVLNTNKKKICPTTLPRQARNNNYFIIFVPDGEKKNLRTDLLSFTNNNTLTLPIGFFGLNNPSKIHTPTFLYFNWKKKSPGLNTNFSNQAHSLNQGITQLCKKAHCIIITQGTGGLLLNKASQENTWDKTNITVIQIGTPIPSDTKKYKDFLPNLKNISTFYSFYSDYPFSVSSLAPKAQTTHPANILTAGIAYQIKLFIENKTPQQTDLFKYVLGQRLFNILNTIKKNYHVHRDLSAYISHKQQNVFVIIKKQTTPPQESQKKLKKRWDTENTFSTNQKTAFKNTYGEEPSTGLSPRELIHAKYKTA